MNTGLEHTFLRTVSYKVLHKIDRRLQSFVLVKIRNWFHIVIDSEMVVEEYSKKKGKTVLFTIQKYIFYLPKAKKLFTLGWQIYLK